MAKHQIGSGALSALKLLQGDGGVFEIRVLVGNKIAVLDVFGGEERLVDKKAFYSGFFNSPEKAYEALCEFEHEWISVYITLDKIDRGVTDKLEKAHRLSCTLTDDVESRRFILIDIDGDDCLSTAHRISVFCKSYEMPDAIIASSGSGIHVLYKCEILAESKIINKLTEKLAKKYNSDTVKIDIVCANPARISKLYGTESKNRHTSLMHIPETLISVSEEDLRWC